MKLRRFASCLIAASCAALLVGCWEPAQSPVVPPTPTEATWAAPVIHAAATSPAAGTLTATLSLTPSATPTRTVPPSATRSITPTWTPTLAPPTAAISPTWTATHTPTHLRPTAAPPTSQIMGTPMPQTYARVIVISGALEALQRDGEARWAGIGIECLDVRGQVIARLPVLAWQGVYALPSDTHQVRLWIGAELGAETWWRDWSAQPVGVADDPILMRIERLGSAPAPTSAPTAPPTVIPTAVPTAISTTAPTAVPTAVPTYTPG